MIKKNLDLIFVAFIMIAIIMYEVTIELLGEFLHLTLEVLHNLFEVVELGVEEVVEWAFHVLDIGETVEFLFITERHGSQVITFYILVIIIAYGFYKLVRYIPRVYVFLKRVVLMSWIRRKTQVQLFWQPLNQMHKAAVLATALSVFLLVSLIII